MVITSTGRLIYSILEILGALLCIIITANLVKKLYFSASSSMNVTTTKQVIKPSSKMKSTAILCGMVLFIGFLFKAALLFNSIDIGNVSNKAIDVFGHLGNLLTDVGQAVFFRYFVLSLKNKMKSNEIVRHAISNKVLLCTQILIITNLCVSIISTVCIQTIHHVHEHDDSSANIVVVLYILINLILNLMIDVLLIYLYTRVVHSYASNFKFHDDGFTNDRHHLLLLIITRYCSLFILSALIDLVNAVCQLFWIFVADDYFLKEHAYWTVIAGIFELFDVIIYILAIYFSFSFNNLMYEKYCFCCHNFIYGKVHRVIVRQHSSNNINNDYVMMLEDDDDMPSYNQMNSVNSQYSHSSRHKETNYFEDDLYVTT